MLRIVRLGSHEAANLKKKIAMIHTTLKHHNFSIILIKLVFKINFFQKYVTLSLLLPNSYYPHNSLDRFLVYWQLIGCKWQHFWHESDFFSNTFWWLTYKSHHAGMISKYKHYKMKNGRFGMIWSSSTQSGWEGIDTLHAWVTL